MPNYRKLGLLPAKRHIQLRRDPEKSFLGEGLYYEHLLTTNGFDRAYSIMYHLRPPTRINSVEFLGDEELRPAEDLPLRPFHLRTAEMPRNGDLVSGRVPLMFNDDLTCYRCRPAASQTRLFRNGAADEVIFIQAGKGVAETTFGRLEYRRGDYLVMPRTTIFRLIPDDVANEDYLILECHSPVRTPERYSNPDGQIMLGAPYYERDFHGPSELQPVDEESPTEVLTKDGKRMTLVTMAHHPLDVAGWDGFVYPYTFNAWDFEPLTGTVHLPPPYQQTFECRGFVICTLLPGIWTTTPRPSRCPTRTRMCKPMKCCSMSTANSDLARVSTSAP